MLREERHDLLVKLHRFGRIGDLADFVGAIMDRETVPFMTGEILHADGGRNVGF
jgi:NAD(P)-dependent dehydrogenase (short-subunit alcohol dehydrogenase family)